MGKHKESSAHSSKRKRKPSEKAAAAAAEDIPQHRPKKAKKQAEPAAAQPAAKEQKKSKKSQPADSKPAKKETKPSKKAESKPAKQADAKPAKTTSTKSAAKPVSKPAKTADAKPASQSDGRPSRHAEKKKSKAQKQQPEDGQRPKRQVKKTWKQADEQLSAGEDEEQEQDGEADKSVHDMFMEEVHAKEAELNKHCLIMGQVETDEDETTLEELRALTRVFVPQKVQDDFMEVWEELDEVGQDSEGDEGEEEDEDDADQPDILGAIMKAILGGKMLNTKHSSHMHTIFKTHQDQIDKAIKSKGWEEAFCRWAAVLMASHREKHWYEDTDVPKSAEAVFKRMRQQWLKLKARSDEELGGLVAEGSKTAKEEFDAYLQAVADDMRAMDYTVQDVLG